MKFNKIRPHGILWNLWQTSFLFKLLTGIREWELICPKCRQKFYYLIKFPQRLDIGCSKCLNDLGIDKVFEREIITGKQIERISVTATPMIWKKHLFNKYYGFPMPTLTQRNAFVETFIYLVW